MDKNLDFVNKRLPSAERITGIKYSAIQYFETSDKNASYKNIH